MCPLFCLSWFALAASAVSGWTRLFYQVSSGIILAKELTKGEDYFFHYLFTSLWHSWEPRPAIKGISHKGLRCWFRIIKGPRCFHYSNCNVSKKLFGFKWKSFDKGFVSIGGKKSYFFLLQCPFTHMSTMWTISKDPISTLTHRDCSHFHCYPFSLLFLKFLMCFFFTLYYTIYHLTIFSLVVPHWFSS